MATDGDRITALEVWADTATTVLRALARKASPDRGVDGQEVGLAVVPDEIEDAAMRDAIPLPLRFWAFGPPEE